MADLSITAASVVKGTGAVTVQGTAGAAIAAGDQVYYDSGTQSYKLADCNSATAAARVASGTALNGAASGQPLTVQTSGPITIGATVAVGVTYFLSGTAGKIRPAADNTTGDYVQIVGIGISTTQISLGYHSAGAPMA